MLACFGKRREWRIALALCLTAGLAGCGGMANMKDILTDKPTAAGAHRAGVKRQSATPQQSHGATAQPAAPLDFPPGQ
jgi:hypothetical protein